DRSTRQATADPHLGDLRRQSSQRPSLEGLRDGASCGRTSQRRRLRRLSVRSAADGRGGTCFLHGEGREPLALLLREIFRDRRSGGMIFAHRFAGKTLVVTGAAQGIGRSVALRAAAEGGNVLFVDRADFVGDVASEAGARGRGFVCDLEAYEGATRAMAEAVRCFGGVDILVN